MHPGGTIGTVGGQMSTTETEEAETSQRRSRLFFCLQQSSGRAIDGENPDSSPLTGSAVDSAVNVAEAGVMGTCSPWRYAPRPHHQRSCAAFVSTPQYVLSSPSEVRLFDRMKPRSVTNCDVDARTVGGSTRSRGLRHQGVGAVGDRCGVPATRPPIHGPSGRTGHRSVEAEATAEDEELHSRRVGRSGVEVGRARQCRPSGRQYRWRAHPRCRSWQARRSPRPPRLPEGWHRGRG
jgi:hypothetical protein